MRLMPRICSTSTERLGVSRSEPGGCAVAIIPKRPRLRGVRADSGRGARAVSAGDFHVLRDAQSLAFPAAAARRRPVNRILAVVDSDARHALARPSITRRAVATCIKADSNPSPSKTTTIFTPSLVMLSETRCALVWSPRLKTGAGPAFGGTSRGVPGLEHCWPAGRSPDRVIGSPVSTCRRRTPNWPRFATPSSEAAHLVAPSGRQRRPQRLGLQSTLRPRGRPRKQQT